MVEAFHLSHAVFALHELQVLASLGQPSTARTVARKLKLDPGLLAGLLEYVALRTTLVHKSGNRFVATEDYSSQSRFLLDLYHGAFGRTANQLRCLLEGASGGDHSVDRVLHARAFSQVGESNGGWEVGVIRQLKFNQVLDIGCGSGALLVHLALHDAGFLGWGVESNPAMCRIARGRIRKARVGKRITLLQGDSTALRTVLSPEARASIQAVVARQVANEFFGRGTSRVVTWLRGLRRVLPGRPMLLADYYGRLGGSLRGIQRETILHDYAQVISGQGIPPSSLREWEAIYAKAGCRLIHVLEDRHTTRFIHIVVL
jgi:SAM-dependent methyltransferase